MLLLQREVGQKIRLCTPNIVFVELTREDVINLTAAQEEFIVGLTARKILDAYHQRAPIEISVQRHQRGKLEIGIDAPKSLRVLRSELAK